MQVCASPIVAAMPTSAWSSSVSLQMSDTYCVPLTERSARWQLNSAPVSTCICTWMQPHVHVHMHMHMHMHTADSVSAAPPSSPLHTSHVALGTFTGEPPPLAPRLVHHDEHVTLHTSHVHRGATSVGAAPRASL